MANECYGIPLLVGPDGRRHTLNRVSLSAPESGADYSELFIQDLAFKYPECLPIDEIDRAYAGIVPVCMELQTPAGPVDALYVTPTGKLAVL